MLLKGAKARDALIYKYLKKGQHPESTDFGLLGLDKGSWDIYKGRRTVRYYKTPKLSPTDTQLIVVKDHYKYIMNGHEIVSFERDLEWFDRKGNIIYEKIISPHSNVGNITYLNKLVRDNQFNVLRELGKGTPNEQYIIMLMNYYKTQIDEYILLGTNTLYDAILNETDPTILAILGGPTTDPLLATVKGAIFYQITE